MWSPAPTGNLARSEALWKVPFTSSDSRISRPRWWKNRGLFGSLPTGRKVSRLAGKPKQRRWAKRQKVSDAAPRDAAPWPRAPGRAPTLPTRQPARRASASQIPAPSRPPPPPPPLLPARLRQGAELPPRAATEKPRRVGGGGERGAAPAGSSSSRRPVMLTPAPAPGARPPLPSLRRVAVTESPRLRRVRRSRAAAARSESPGEAPAHSSLSAGEAAAPGAREQPRLGRAEVRPAAGRRGGLLRAASARSQRLALAAAAGEAARPRGAGLRPGPRPLSP